MGFPGGGGGGGVEGGGGVGRWNERSLAVLEIIVVMIWLNVLVVVTDQVNFIVAPAAARFVSISGAKFVTKIAWIGSSVSVGTSAAMTVL